MVLFALTKFSAYAFYLMAALYLFVAAYALFGGWRLKNDTPKVRLVWFLLLPTGLFVMLWFSGLWIWALFYWIFVFGDAGPYEEYGRFTSGLVALVIAATVFVRLALGRINHNYLRITSWVTIASALLLLTVLTHEFTNRIYGWSARGAAEKYLDKYHAEKHPFVAAGAQRRVVEENTSNAGTGQKQVRRFVLYYGNAPIQEVKVAPYGWFWWTFASSKPVHPALDLDWAVDNWETDREEATERLNHIIKNYPDTEASRWATDVLPRLRERGNEGIPSWKSEMIRRLQQEAKKRRTQTNETKK